MSPRTVERVDDWETVPFGGGYRGLQDLVSQEFSGVVTSGTARLFAIRGTVVGILDGDLDDFEGADGTAREAPHHALPLLAVMQERSDEVRAQYYTEDTPIADVNRTLEDGGFTGYVELSENVLSGDYYQVYHQGRSMSVAYVGASERLITDDDAFEQADDEVGIYEVRPVDIDPIEIPEPEPDRTADAGGSSPGADEPTGQDSAGADSGDDAGSAPDVDADDESDADDGADDEPRSEAPSGPAAADGSASASATTGGGTDAGEEAGDVGTASPTDAAGASADGSATEAGAPSRRADDRPGADADGRAQRGRSAEAAASEPGDERPADSADDPGQRERRSDPAAGSSRENDRPDAPADHSAPESPTSPERAEQSGAAPSGGRSGDAGPAEGAAAPAQSAVDLETRSIPSLNPSRTAAASKSDGSADGTEPPRQGQRRSQSETAGGGAGGSSQSTSGEAQADADAANRSARRASGTGSGGQDAAGGSARGPSQTTADAEQTTQAADRQRADQAPANELRQELEEREEELADLRADLERVEAEREDLEAEREDLRAERDRLDSELADAREEIERLEDQLEDFAAENAVDAETQLSPSQAIDETNLFVRYRSKGDATLESVHAGDASRADVADNLRLEYHTQFDADSADVGSETFDEFLTNTIQYRFVQWLVENLVYEIRDTGHTEEMADLYNALPKIDRAELNGQVSVSYTEDGEEHRSQERFDVVVRDRMGNPIIVANINDSRDPATDSMMTDLIKRAERVGESSASLAGAMLVTESFFEPPALETADEATSSGLFSRDKRRSYVNLSRKDGFHLCLVEARNQEFHVAVPEL